LKLQLIFYFIVIWFESCYLGGRLFGTTVDPASISRWILLIVEWNGMIWGSMKENVVFVLLLYNFVFLECSLYLVFKEKEIDWDGVWYSFFYQIVIWVKCNDESFSYTRLDLFCLSDGLHIWINRINMRNGSSWLPSPIGMLKLTRLQMANQGLQELVVFLDIMKENSFVFFPIPRVIWNLMKLRSCKFEKLCI